MTEPSSSTYKVTEDLTYDAFGNVATDTVTGINMAARTTTLTWSNGTYPTGQFPLSIQSPDPAASTTQFTYNYSYGQIASLTDPNSTVQTPIVTQWQYDDFERKIQETRPDSTYTTWAYTLDTGAPIARMIVTEQPHDTANNIITTTTSYHDMLDRLLYTNNTLLDGTIALTVGYTYDALGRVLTSSFPYRLSDSSVGNWSYSYDVLNRLTQMQRPVNSAPHSPVQTVTYAYAGRTETMTDPNNNVRTLVTDVNGWQRQTKDAYEYTVTTTYDAAGSVTGVTDSNSATLLSNVTYAYGIAPFRLTALDADLGSWSYTYDALGEKTAWIDAKNQHYSQTYDALSRPLTRSEPDYFTQWTWGTSATNHNIGKLASLCSGLGTNPTACTTSGYSESETYDSLARVSQRAIVIPSTGTYTYTWQYNATTGLLNTLTFPAVSGFSMQLQYAYQNGLLKSVTDIADSPNVTVWQGNAVDAAGHITQETAGDGVITNRTYDAVTQWLGSITAGIGGGTGLQNQAFLYDQLGNLTQRQDYSLGLTENIYYDNDYRLTSSTLNNVQNLAITYDNTMGNITSRSDIASGAPWTYSSTQIHAVTRAGDSAHTYQYDANGNATSRWGSTVSWTSYNYPTSISAGSGGTAETVSFAYGPDRSRWQQVYTGNGTTETTDYIGGLLERVQSGASTDYRYYLYAGREPVAVYARNVKLWRYFKLDHQGGVAGIVGSNGSLIMNESFTPFGARRNSSTWSGPASNTALTTTAGISRQGYTFQTQLGLWMNLNHMNGRVQDAVTGRFLSADPNIPDSANPQSYNRYSYVVNNPLTFTDPTGFFQQCSFSQQYRSYTTVEDNELTVVGYTAYVDQCFDIPDYVDPGTDPGHGPGPGPGTDPGTDPGKGTNPPTTPPQKNPTTDPPQKDPPKPCGIPEPVVQGVAGAVGGAIGGAVPGLLTGNPALAVAGAVTGGLIGGLVGGGSALANSSGQSYGWAAASGMQGEPGGGAWTSSAAGSVLGNWISSSMQSNGYSTEASNFSGGSVGGAAGGAGAAILAGQSVGMGTLLGTIAGAAGAAFANAVSSTLHTYNAVFCSP